MNDEQIERLAKVLAEIAWAIDAPRTDDRDMRTVYEDAYDQSRGKGWDFHTAHKKGFQAMIELALSDSVKKE